MLLFVILIYKSIDWYCDVTSVVISMWTGSDHLILCRCQGICCIFYIELCVPCDDDLQCSITFHSKMKSKQSQLCFMASLLYNLLWHVAVSSKKLSSGSIKYIRKDYRIHHSKILLFRVVL
jgi:hypothetical protein